MNEHTMKIANVPKWCNYSRVPDPEVLVVLCQELEAAGFHRMEPQLEDSRTGQKIIIEAALIFDERHASDDPYYWTSKDFLVKVEGFAREVVQAVKSAGPEFYNKEHHTMYGKAELKDVMATPNAVTPPDPDKMLARARELHEATKHLPVRPDLTRDELAHAICSEDPVSEWPNGYCDWCRYLEPTEADQTGEKEPHRCTFLNQRIEHGAFHPRLPTPDNCPILLVEEYQSGRATGKSEMTMDELAKEINDNVRNKSGIPREFFETPQFLTVCAVSDPPPGCELKKGAVRHPEYQCQLCRKQFAKEDMVETLIHDLLPFCKECYDAEARRMRRKFDDKSGIARKYFDAPAEPRSGKMIIRLADGAVQEIFTDLDLDAGVLTYVEVRDYDCDGVENNECWKDENGGYFEHHPIVRPLREDMK